MSRTESENGSNSRSQEAGGTTATTHVTVDPVVHNVQSPEDLSGDDQTAELENYASDITVCRNSPNVHAWFG